MESFDGGNAFGGSRETRADAGAQRGPDWVSKTDLIRYAHCPYAWWLLDRGDITFEETVDEFQFGLLREGSSFEGLVKSSATPIEIGAQDLPSLMVADVKVLGTPGFENDQLRIFGRPDGIETAHGALLPIEIKSHKNLQRTDELELAFYWLLLQPQRTRRVQPLGILILRRDGAAEEVEVPIRKERFADVRRLIREIRRARRQGVRPRVCGCTVCSRTRRVEVLTAVTAREDVTLIHGVGRRYASALEQIGITTWRALLSRDASEIVDAMRERSYYLSERQIEMWQAHARSYATAMPFIFGSEFEVPESFIALDLEYGTHLWLIGACVVCADGRDYYQLWADGGREVEANLAQLAVVLAEHSTLPVLTWGGNGADLPQLRGAAARLALPELTLRMQERHLDLYRHVWRTLRLPIPSLGLKEVGTYFGVARLSSVHDGLEAQLVYSKYSQARSSAKAGLRQELIDYNRDDLDALIEVARRVRGLLSLRRHAPEPVSIPTPTGPTRRVRLLQWSVPPRRLFIAEELNMYVYDKLIPK